MSNSWFKHRRLKPFITEIKTDVEIITGKKDMVWGCNLETSLQKNNTKVSLLLFTSLQSRFFSIDIKGTWKGTNPKNYIHRISSDWDYIQEGCLCYWTSKWHSMNATNINTLCVLQVLFMGWMSIQEDSSSCFSEYCVQLSSIVVKPRNLSKYTAGTI